MHAAILCPGPSLNRFPGRDELSPGAGFDLLIGVNRAATRIACDVWASGDIYPLEDIGGRIHTHVRPTPNGAPIWLTTTETHEWAIRNRIIWPGSIVHFDDLKPAIQSIDWTFFTVYAAIAYAVTAAAKTISIFGADWSGTADFDGVAAGLTRDDNRWQTERTMFERVREELHERGIQLHRIVRPN